MAYGVIGNTTGFGPVILGSSPSRPTQEPLEILFFEGFFVGGRVTELLIHLTSSFSIKPYLSGPIISSKLKAGMMER